MPTQQSDPHQHQQWSSMRTTRRRVLKNSHGLLLLVALGLSSSLTVLVSGFAGSHPTKIDAFMRQALCSNQAAMCAVSCQNSVQAEYCNTETLEWTCECSQGITGTINRWQYPIPFSLCRTHLLECIKACPKLDRDLTDGSPDQQMRFQTHSNSGEVDNSQAEGDDMDQDDYDAIQELRVLGQYDRLEDSSYSRFQVEGLREQLATKKRQLHKQLWAAERRQRQRQHQRIEAEIYSSLNSVVSFTTLTDPTSLHAGGCVAHCHEVLACGTETAPEYHGIQQIKSPSSHAG